MNEASICVFLKLFSKTTMSNSRQRTTPNNSQPSTPNYSPREVTNQGRQGQGPSSGDGSGYIIPRVSDRSSTSYQNGYSGNGLDDPHVSGRPPRRYMDQHTGFSSLLYQGQPRAVNDGRGRRWNRPPQEGNYRQSEGPSRHFVSSYKGKHNRSSIDPNCNEYRMNQSLTTYERLQAMQSMDAHIFIVIEALMVEARRTVLVFPALEIKPVHHSVASEAEIAAKKTLTIDTSFRRTIQQVR